MKNKIKQITAFLIVFAMLIPFFSFHLKIYSADTTSGYRLDWTTDSRIVIIDEAFVAAHGTKIVIPNGAFSVTVNGVDVDIIFENVKIDRTNDSTGGTTFENQNFYEAGERLGWTDTFDYYSIAYVPTCPFLLTGNATVNARFDGECEFRAGTNMWIAYENRSGYSQTTTYQPTSGYSYKEGVSGTIHPGGYAAIQVEEGSSLTINGANNLKAYGAYQLAGEKESGRGKKDYSVTYNGKDLTDPFNVNTVYDGSITLSDGTTVKAPIYGEPWDVPSGIETSNGGEINGGGAGIGGGAKYNQRTTHVSGNNYRAGTPGEIIINAGTITAVGGHLAAGIGGGVNSNATHSQIVINGGDIRAVGGRFACGIGTGDTTSGHVSTCYYNEASIIINGGEVRAYGGTCSAAIGTTDNLFDSGVKSPLSIQINGGYVYAQSGQGKNYTEATAGIGAGNASVIRDSHISISSSAEVVAASFSKYAISNFGDKADNRPVIRVDHLGYMYFVRFDPVNFDRNIKIHPIKHDNLGNPMLVNKTAQIAAGIDAQNIPGGTVFYARDVEGCYRVNEDGSLYNGVKEYATGVELNLSYYFDHSKIIGNIDVPALYTAVSRSLPNPAEYGGYYVLSLPLTGSQNLYSILEKTEAGSTTGEIVNSGKEYHLIITADGKINEYTNIKVDPTANPLTKLDVTADGISGFIGDDFAPKTYGYDVYLPYGTKSFTVDSLYKILDENINSTIVLSVNADNNSFKITDKDGKEIDNESKLYYTGTSAEMSNEFTIDMGDNKEIEIWLRKTDTSTNGSFSEPRYISYKINVVSKPKHSIVFDDPSKVYDGTRVGTNGLYLSSGNLQNNKVDIDVLQTVSESTQYELITASHEHVERTATLGGDTYNYIISHGTGYDKTGNAKFVIEVTESGNKVTSTVTVDLKNGSVICTGTATTGTLKISGSSSADGKVGTVRVQKGRGAIYDLVTFTIKTGIDPKDTVSSKPSDYEAQKEAATIGLFSKDAIGKVDMSTIRDGFSSISEEFITYETSRSTSVSTLTISSGGGLYSHDHEYNVINIKNSTDSVRARYSKDEDLTGEMTALEKNDIKYDYYLDKNNDGIFDSEELLSPLGYVPSDAGHYLVKSELNAEKYEAYGQMEFVISKRHVTVVAISNWMYYTSREALLNYDGTVADCGRNGNTIYLNNVISGDTVNVIANGKYVDFGSSGYSDDIGFNNEKIHLTEIQFETENFGNDYLNYTIDKECYVPGQIIYRTDGAMFRHTDEEGSKWDKFYPPDSKTPLDFTKVGNDFIDPAVDYHSPSESEHRAYIRLRAVNGFGNSARYAVDIECGAMQFTFSRRVWNVNTYKYEDVEGESRWSGLDGVNNKITVINYSNREIMFEAETEIDFIYEDIGNNYGITSFVSKNNDGTDIVNKGERVTVNPATAGANGVKGTESKEDVFVIMRGVPQTNSKTFLTVGSVTVNVYGKSD